MTDKAFLRIVVSFVVLHSDKLEIESDNNMQVPQLDFALSDENTSHLRGLVDPLEDYGDHGVGNFLQVVEFASILDS